MRSLVVVGAGGLGREVVEAVRAINDVAPAWNVLGFADDDAAAASHVGGHPVLGTTAVLDDLPDAAVVVCVGRPSRNWSRKVVVDRLALPAERYATIVHPAAVLPRGTRLGPGSVVLAGVIATTALDIGAHVAVMPGGIFTHDDQIADFATFGAGVRLAGGVCVGEGAYLGAGALVREECSIGRWALVGMGAVVTSHVPAGEVWAGVPARRLRVADVPAELLQADAPS